MSKNAPKFKLGDAIFTTISKGKENTAVINTTVTAVTIAAGAQPMYSLNVISNGVTLNRFEDLIFETFDACIEASLAPMKIDVKKN